ncbi:hypothetical protein DFH09DRAFT_1152523 [Mycena vulgaris]|nr:hypothetical protein DFH09DRAFT_1152523 [Mycena vulgaris]
MAQLPAEIHLKIYSSACRDDGRTGSSLSSVSRRIRQLSAEHRYQSIAVCGPIQIQRLLECLRLVPPELRRIRFLYIYDYSSLSNSRDTVVARDGPIKSPRPARSRGRFAPSQSFTPEPAPRLIRELIQSMNLFDNDWDRLTHDSAHNVGRNIIELLALAHETVEFLSLICFDHKLSADDPEIPLQLLQGNFPVLTDLTVRGPHELPCRTAFAPFLRTLHVTETTLCRRFFCTMANNHPDLSRLRISRFLDIHKRAVDIIGILYAMRITSATKWAESKKLPPRMLPGVQRLVLIEPSTSRTPDRQSTQVLELLQKWHSGLLGFRVLPAHPGHNMRREANLALVDWNLAVTGTPMEWGACPGKPAWD